MIGCSYARRRSASRHIVTIVVDSVVARTASSSIAVLSGCRSNRRLLSSTGDTCAQQRHGETGAATLAALGVSAHRSWQLDLVVVPRVVSLVAALALVQSSRQHNWHGAVVASAVVGQRGGIAISSRKCRSPCCAHS